MLDKMKTTEKNVFDNTDGFSFIFGLVASDSYEHVLLINPRSGEDLEFLIKRNPIIDSFVSDEQWVEPAKSFSINVFAGYSHKPLLQVPDAAYDLILVCEDIGYVDDCDAMLREYHRLLKPGGTLAGGVYNLRYADNIDRLLGGNVKNCYDNLCGNAVIPIDCLIVRLGELGFSHAEIHNLQGERKDIGKYADISALYSKPASSHMFSTKIHFIRACK